MNCKTMLGVMTVLGLIAAPAVAAELKIGVVDYGRLMEESPQAKAANEAIRNEFSPRQRELQTQQTSLKAREDKLQKDAATMTPDQRSNAERELRDSAREFARRQNEIQDDFNARRNEELSRLQRTLTEQVRAYAKAQNFDLIIADGVIYTTPTIDITPQILAALQAHAPAASTRAPGGTPPPAAPAPPKPQGH